jgi:hypothetical protein
MNASCDQYEVVCERLTRLERQNRRWKLGAAALLVLGVLSLIVGQSGPNKKILEADAFVVTDSGGTGRAVLSMSDSQGPTLTMNDGQGRTRAVLSVLQDKACLALLDPDGTPRLRFGADARGSEIVFNDKDSVTRLSLQQDADGSLIALGDATANARIGIGVPADDTAHMTIFNQSERPVWRAPK